MIAGGDPAGYAHLIAESRNGRLDDLMADGLALIERESHLGSGSIGRYSIASDSTLTTHLPAIEGHADPCLGHLRGALACEALRNCGQSAAPLEAVAEFLDLIGKAMRQAVCDGSCTVTRRLSCSSGRRDRGESA